MKFGYILDAVNKAISVSNLFGTKAGNHSTVDGVPLGTVANSTTGEVVLKVSVRENTSSAVTDTFRYNPSITLALADGTVALGARYISFIFSSTFVGTIAGVAFSGATDSFYDFPLLPLGSTYGVITYTITAGSARVTRF